MTDLTVPDAPQLYLIAPALVSETELADRLAAVLDTHPVACLRLPGSGDEAALGRLADLVRDIAHARDVAVVIDNHVALARAHGLDGVHLTDGARTVRYARKELGSDAIVGAFCGTSRHEGMNAGEAGADYRAYVRSETCDGGRFSFSDLPDGGWFLIVPVRAQGDEGPMVLMRHVTTRGGRVVSVTL